MKLSRSILLLTVLVLGSCSNGKIPLEYRFDPGEGTRYLWTINSQTTVNSTTEQSMTELNMVIDVHEQVVQFQEGEDAVLSIALTPRSLQQGGRTLPTPEPVTVRYEMSPEGEVLRPVTEDLTPQAASALELGSTLIRTRIALAPDPVNIGEEWDASLLLDGDLGNIQLEGKGKLLGFELKDRRTLARIETKRSGDIVTHERRGGVPVRLRGTSTSDALSSLDVDNGVLHSSVAQFVSEFDIASQETGKLLGNMRVTLNSTLELQPA